MAVGEDEVFGEGDAFVDGQPIALYKFISAVFRSLYFKDGRGLRGRTMSSMKFSRTDSKCEYPGIAIAQ